MQQTELTLHLLGTAPPMPPPPLWQSLPEPPLIPGCGRRANMAGGEGLHAPLEQHGSVQPRQHGHRKSSASKHQQNTARQHACMRAMHSKATSPSHAGYALQSKQCIAHRPTCSFDVLASSRPLHFRAGSAHTSKGERMAASVTSLPQFVVR